MKKFSFILAAAALFCAVSCQSDKGGEDAPSVYFKSFGFYAEDNPGLDKDYVITSNLKKVSDIAIKIPNDADPAVLASLAPRFTLSSDDVVVKVGEALLVSADQVEPDLVQGVGRRAVADSGGEGEPEPEVESFIYTLDLSAPVEIILSNGKRYKNYYLSGGIESSWRKVAEGDVSLFGGSTAAPAYDAKNDQFYIASVINADSDEEKYPILYKYKAGAFAPAAGSDGVIAKRRSDTANNVAVAADGTPYVSFVDYIDIDGKATAEVSAASVKDGAVSILGEAGAIYAANTAYYTHIFPFAANNVWVACTNKANVTTAPALNRRLLNLAQFDGSAWTNAKAIAGRSASDYGYFPISYFADGKGRLFVANQNVGTYSVYKNTGTDWSALAEGVAPIDQDGSALVKASVSYYGGLGVDASGNAYILAQGKLDGENWCVALEKIGADGKLSLVGGIIPGTESSNGSVQASVAFAADGTPYVAFQSRGGSLQPMVSKLDAASGTWKTEAVSAAKVGRNVYACADKNGKILIFAVEDGAKHAVVYAAE